MIIAAIDSAELSGLAVVERGPAGEKALHHGTARIRTAADVAAAAFLLVSFVPDVIAIEEPFAHPRNPITGMTLARLLGRWLQAFETAGLTTVTIPSSLWQPGILPGFSPRMRSVERKAAAQQLARKLFALDVSEDEADALGIAVYVARNATAPEVCQRPLLRGAP